MRSKKPRLIDRNLSGPLYFVISALFLTLLLGVMVGFKGKSTIVKHLGEMRVALQDLVDNPLTVPVKYATPSGLVRYGPHIDKGYLLISGYLVDEQRIGIRLLNLATGQVVHSWYPDPSEIRLLSDYPDFKQPNRFEPQSPYLMPDGDLVFIDNQGPLVRIDACSKVKWIVDGWFHHSIERDLDGNFVVPAVLNGPTSSALDFRDDSVFTVSVDGKVVGKRSVARLLSDNGYDGLFHTAYPLTADPIHLNDIEVASYSSEHWRRGDWLMSIRSLNAVMIYRPQTNKMIWLKVGPWLKQHDPDFLRDGSISVFGNNVVKGQFVTGHSEVYVVSIDDEKVTAPFSHVLKSERVGTPTQGRARILENGDVFIEETDHGRLLRLNAKGLVWSYHNSDSKEAGRLSWSRYLPRIGAAPVCDSGRTE